MGPNLLPLATWYEHLAPALLHTLWQGLVIAALLYLVLRVSPAQQTRGRYALSVAALGMVVLGWMLTWSWLGYERPSGPRNDSIAPRATYDGVTHDTVTHDAVTPDAGEHHASYPRNAISVVPTEHSTSRSSAGLLSTFGQSWRWLLAWCWLAGVGLMSVRLLLMVRAHFAGARAEIAAPQLDDQVAPLARVLRVTRRVRVATVDHLASPAVYGVLYPTILLPLAVLSETTPDQLRFILAHELAHIRRYDYLVNLAQMAIEALLFFNPAVWWISRQIRMEREACCDALAVRATGDAAGYARTLVDWSARMRFARGMQGALAFAEEDRSTQLRDRVSRLMLPEYRPVTRISPAALVGLLLIGALVLSGVFQGTTVAVAVAAEIMNPQERIERIEKVEQEFAPKIPDRNAQVGISGTVKTEDGGPLEKSVSLSSYVMRAGSRGSSSTQSSVRVTDGQFRATVGAGSLWIWAQQPGYAVALVGPIDVSADAPPKSVDLVLNKGYAAQLLVADRNGKPVAGAKVAAQLAVPARGGSQCYIALGSTESDAFGQCTIEHATNVAGTEARVSVTAPGFQQVKNVPIALDEVRVSSVALVPARPTTGAIVFAADATPAAGAEVRLVEMTQRTAGHSQSWHESPPALLAVCNEQGHFALDTLMDDTQYDLLICGPDGSRALLSDVTAGRTDLNVKLGQPIVLHGKVLGVEKLDKQKTLSYRNDGQSNNSQFEVNVRDGEGTFELTGLLPTKLEVWGAGSHFDFDLSKLTAEQRNELVLDLAAPAAVISRRKVIVELEVPAGSPAPSGSVIVNAEAAEVRDGRAEFELPVGRVVYCDSDGLSGYWFPQQQVNVDAGDEPLVVKIALRPAGSIYGKITWPRAKDEPNITYSIFEVDRPTDLLEGESFPYNQSIRAKNDEQKYAIAPLPLGGTFYVLARQGALTVLSQPIALTAQAPVMEVNFERPATVDVRGTVADERGRPIAGAGVSFECSFDNAMRSFSFGAGAVSSDQNGAFTLANLGIDPRIRYSLIVRRAGQQPFWLLDFQPKAEPLDIHLEPGHRLHGKVFDRSGKPLANAHLLLLPAVNLPARLPQSATTDGTGAFDIDTLPAGEVALSVEGQEFKVMSGGNEPVEVHLKQH